MKHHINNIATQDYEALTQLGPDFQNFLRKS